MNLTRNSWELGWTPNADPNGGDPRGLLRMDNLCLDKDGAVTLVKSNTNVSPNFGYKIHSLYSNNIRNQKFRFAGLADRTVRYYDGSSWSTFLSGGDDASAAFGSGLGHIYVCSGSIKKKFDGTSITDITPDEPESAPTIQEAAKNDYVLYNNDFGKFVVVKGANFTGAASPYFETEAAEGILEYPGPWDLTVYPLTQAKYQIDDVLWLQLKPSDADSITKVTIMFNLDDSYDPTSNHFSYSWVRDDFTTKDGWTTLKAVRQDFIKTAVDINKGWNDVKSFRIHIEVSGAIGITINENGILFVGSDESPLTGYYEYCQVNVNNNGSYIARSVRSPESPFVQLINGKALVTPYTNNLDPQVNEIWIYRRSATYVSDVVERGEPPALDQWYRVKVLDSTTGFGQFADGVSDYDAILGNEVNPDDVESISRWTDQYVFDIAGPFGGRFFYMGDKDIYISMRFDPGRYRPRQNLRLSGEVTEKNLWVKKLNEQTLLVGTTEDIYEITGTMQDLPDGGIDLRVNALGIAKAPISKSASTENRTLFFIAPDGIRTTTEVITAPLQKLFDGDTLHDFPGVQIVPFGYGDYGLAVAYGKLWFSCPLTNGSRGTFVYDFRKNYWYPITGGAYNLCTEEDGTLIGGFDDGYVKELDSGNDVLSYLILTVKDYNSQPNNRKESFSFRPDIHSPDYNVLIQVQTDADALTELLDAPLDNNFNANAVTDISFLEKCHYYQLKIQGSSNQLKLNNFTFYYEPAPEPLAYLKIKYNNFKSAALKRIATQPFVIDTLGNTVQITPYIDQVTKTTQQFTSTDKRTLLYYFTGDTEGIDWEYVIQAVSGRFEFYDMLEPEVLETLPVAKKYDQIGPTEFNRIGVLTGMRIRVRINTGGQEVTLPINIYAEDELIHTWNIVTSESVDKVYEKMRFPQTKYGTVVEAKIGPSTPEVTFNRYWVEWHVNIGGSQAESQILRIR